MLTITFDDGESVKAFKRDDETWQVVVTPTYMFQVRVRDFENWLAVQSRTNHKPITNGE